MFNYLSDYSSRFDKVFMVAAFILAGFLLAFPYAEHVSKIMSEGNQSIMDASRSDCDVPPLMDRMSQCPTFASTGRYWREDYTDQTPFYRPLSLTWFWMLRRFLGVAHSSRWTGVSLVLRAIFDLLLFFLVKRCTRSSWAAIFTVVVFSGSYSLFGVPTFYNALYLSPSTPQDVAVNLWKDQPTLIADSLCLGALICIFRDAWIVAIFLTSVSVLFKESGWITYALGLVLLAGAGRLRSVPLWVYPAVLAALAVPMLLRHSAGMGWIGGLRMGNNGNWPKRLFGAASGDLLHDLFGVQTAAAVFAIASVGGVLLSRKLLSRKLQGKTETFARATWLSGIAAYAIGVLCLCTALNSLFLHTDFATGGEELFAPEMGLPYVGQCELFVIGTCYLALNKRHRRWGATFAICSVIAALPFIAATQVLEHALHLCYAFQSAVTGLAALSISQRIRDWLRTVLKGRRLERMPQN